MSKNISVFSKLCIYLFMAAAIFIFYEDAKSSIMNSGMRCITSLLPGLFPMMVMSRQISSCLDFKNGILSKLLSKLSGFSQGLLPIFFIGLLCGYPVPAIICASRYESGQISREEAEFAAALCNNASPAFIIFFIGADIYGSISAGIALYVSQIFSVILAAHIIKCPNSSSVCLGIGKESPAESIARASKSMLELSGFVIFFSLAADMIRLILERIYLPHIICSTFSGLFEITGGIAAASQLAEPQKALLMCLFTATGGISVYFQISSVLSATDISMKKYLKAKIVTAAIMCISFPFFMKIFRLLSLL